MQVQHLGQKYTGLRPESHTQAMFKATDAQVTGNHPVPISNFMNAQCKHHAQPFFDRLMGNKN